MVWLWMGVLVGAAAMLMLVQVLGLDRRFGPDSCKLSKRVASGSAFRFAGDKPIHPLSGVYAGVMFNKNRGGVE